MYIFGAGYCFGVEYIFGAESKVSEYFQYGQKYSRVRANILICRADTADVERACVRILLHLQCHKQAQNVCPTRALRRAHVATLVLSYWACLQAVQMR